MPGLFHLQETNYACRHFTDIVPMNDDFHLVCDNLSGHADWEMVLALVTKVTCSTEMLPLFFSWHWLLLLSLLGRFTLSLQGEVIAEWPSDIFCMEGPVCWH